MNKQSWALAIFLAGALAQTAPAEMAGWVADSNKLWRVIDGGLVEAGVPLFADPFDKPLTSAWKLDNSRNWCVENGTLANTGYGGAASLTKELGEGFAVEMTVKPLALEPDKEGGFTGVEAGGILFCLQPGRWWWQYRREGETRSAGNWKTEPVPFNTAYRFMIVREPGGAYSWYVDGRLIVKLVEPGVKGGLALRGWRLKAAYDDVKVYSITEKAGGTAGAESGMNLVRNGSFEQFNDHIPPFWAPTAFGNIPVTFGTLEAFRESWAIDASEGREGTASMRLGGERKNGLKSYYCNLRIGQPHVFSAWLKSDAEGLPVELSVSPGTNRVVTVGRAWQRCSLVLRSPLVSRARLVISPKQTGHLWVDAVQLEAGTEPTAYRANPLDSKGGKALAEEPIPTYRIAQAAQAPVLDGRLEDAVWTQRAQLPGLRIPTTLPGQYHDPKEKTEVYLCHDEKNLYVAFRCYRAQGADYGTGKDDEVEVFLDPQLSRSSYYWFRLNSAGGKRQARKMDSSWEGSWTAATARADGVWTAEIAIPLASLELGPLTSDAWGINLARSNARAGEHSCTAPVLNRGMFFHQVARYPQCEWEAPAVLDTYRKARHEASGQVVTVSPESDPMPRSLKVEGKPFFVFAPLQVFHVPKTTPYGNYDETIEKVLDYWVANGFTTIMVGANVDPLVGAWGERIFDKVFTYADKIGMKVVVFWTGHWYLVTVRDHARLETLVKRWKDHPSLLAWMPADEPELYPVKPAEVAEGIQKIKQWDPHHPVYVNYTQMGPASRYAGLPGDILSIDYYLSAVEGRTIAETLRFVDEMESLARPRGIPTWNFLIGGFADHHWREISADEQTAQTYGNVIKGVSGLTFYFGQPMGLEHWARMRQLNGELKELSPILFSTERIGPAGTSDPAILVTVRRQGDKAYVLAVNIEEREIKASFNLSNIENAKAAQGQVLFEKREVNVAGGMFSDRFKPYERHVYELSLRP
jgi:hypothetical protein